MAITSLSTSTLLQNIAKRNNLGGGNILSNISFIASAKLTSNIQAPPTGTQTGDFVLVVCSSDDTNATVPTGFTTLFNVSDNSTNYSISYKFWGSGDSSITVNRSEEHAADSVHGIYVFRNVASVASGTPTPLFTNTGQSQVSFPALATASQNNMLLRIAMIDEGSITSVAYPSPWITTPVYVTGNTGSGDNRVSVALAYYEAPEPTTVLSATYAFSPTMSAGDNNGATIALIPAST